MRSSPRSEPEERHAARDLPGRRTQPERRGILPFLPGAFFLAIKAQADIIPIALVGTFDLLPMNTYHIKSRPLQMRVGEPIPTAGMTLRDTEAVSAKVRAAIEGLHSATPLPAMSS